MELKRFVLTERNNIVDVSKGCVYANGHVGKFILKDNIVYSQYDDSYDLQTCYKIKNTSDNILDLVEVEDLVGYRFWAEDYEHIEKITSEERRIFKITYNDMWYKILAIYKRQSNGDYKRYEVGGKE